MIDATDYYRSGRRLSKAEVELLERRLEKKPSDMKSRCQLVGYYHRHQFDDNNSKERFEQHALWIIENHWKHEIVERIRLDRFINGEAYENAKRLWLSHVSMDGNDLLVLENAARFFILEDKKLAQDLLRKAQKLEPENPHWSRRLAHAYNLDRQFQNALAEQERACALNPSLDLFDFSELPELALRANDVRKAKKYSNQVIKIANTEGTFGRVEFLYKAHIVLGLLLFREGQLDEAKAHLKSSYSTSKKFTIPLYWTNGETRELLQALLDSGESEVVVEFLNQCDSDSHCVQRWLNEIKDGIIPDLKNELPYRDDDDYCSMERFWFNKQISEKTLPSKFGQLRYSTLWQFLIARIEETKPHDWSKILETLQAVPLEAQRQLARQFNYSFLESTKATLTATGIVFDTEHETKCRMVCIFHRNVSEKTLKEAAMPASLGILREPACLVYAGRTSRDDEIDTPIELGKGPYLVIAIDVVGDTNLCALFEPNPIL